jgi:hypothetical protein
MVAEEFSVTRTFICGSACLHGDRVLPIHSSALFLRTSAGVRFGIEPATRKISFRIHMCRSRQEPGIAFHTDQFNAVMRSLVPSTLQFLHNIPAMRPVGQGLARNQDVSS